MYTVPSRQLVLPKASNPCNPLPFSFVFPFLHISIRYITYIPILVLQPDPPHVRVWVLLVVHLGSVCGQLSQLRGVQVTTRRKGKVERGDCDDCMILARVLLNDLNTTELASFPDNLSLIACIAMTLHSCRFTSEQ